MKFKAINRNSEFIRGYKKGKTAVKPGVVVYVLKNRYGGTRIGITSSKKIGNAVRRNRSRRVIRAAVRELGLDMTKPYDLIFVARTRTAKLKTPQVTAMINERLSETGYYDA